MPGALLMTTDYFLSERAVVPPCEPDGGFPPSGRIHTFFHKRECVCVWGVGGGGEKKKEKSREDINPHAREQVVVTFYMRS